MSEADPDLRELEWDSERFGIRVAEVQLAGVSCARARDFLEARAREFELVYVRGASADVMDEASLGRFHGACTDQRETFERSLHDLPSPFRPDAEGEIRSIGRDEFALDLVSLAPQASAYSRFRSDSRFPDPWTDDLYRAWMEASLSRERADEVLAFVSRGHAVGCHTIRVVRETGILELFAVDAPQRGLGIGRALLVAGLHWMADRGLARARVTTQRQNPACRLYRACGYELTSSEEIYHLWPNGGGVVPAGAENE